MRVDSGFATATISVIPYAAFSYVGFSGDFESEGGDIIGQGIGNLSDVQPGQTYKTQVIYTLSAGGKNGTCHVRVDSEF